jgi:hypothetical protein
MKQNKSGFLSILALIAASGLFIVCETATDAEGLSPELSELRLSVTVGEKKTLTTNQKERIASLPLGAGKIVAKNGATIAKIEGNAITGLIEGEKQFTDQKIRIQVKPKPAEDTDVPTIGDVNGDGITDADDEAAIGDVDGDGDTDEDDIKAADINGDGVVDENDDTNGDGIIDAADKGNGDLQETVVSALNLTALVTKPVKDAAPLTTAINTTQYTGTIAWQNNDGSAFAGAAFAASTVYKALVTLTPTSGYTFTGVGENTFTYTGATVSNDANSGVVTITFAATAAGGGGDYTVAAPSSQDLMVKFGILAADYTFNSQTDDDVAETFNALHAYLNDPARFTIDTDNDTAGNIVRLGDYIDLPSLTVAATAQTTQGTQSMTAADRGAISATNTALEEHGALLRLIVVGINSFNRRTDTTDSATPHVVFQFQNVPGLHRMNATNTNTTGYLGSEMHAYLTGNFLDGLKLAGVPDTVLWSPKRLIWKGYNLTGTHEVEDALWLPTEREMVGDGPYTYGTNSKENEETAINQAHLEYYGSNSARIKYTVGNNAMWSWDASPYSGSAANFCGSDNDGAANYTIASSAGGFAPAFCVR